MQITKSEVHELLQRVVQQLRECYSVESEELKTRIKVKVQVKHNDGEIFLANFNIKKTAKEMQQLIDKLRALYAISEDIEHFFKLCDTLDCSVSQLQYYVNGVEIIVRQRYDAPQLKNFVNADEASTDTLSLRAEAEQRLEELRELAEICTIEFSDDMIDIKSFYNALDTLKSLKNNYTEHRQTFNQVLKTVAEFIKAANKLTTRDNAEYLRELRIAKNREAEALKKSDYDHVSKETLKQYLKENFAAFRYDDKLLILDKSSKHRAVLAARLGYIDYVGLVVLQTILAGEDDNGERWSHIIDDFRYDEPAQIDSSRYCKTVEEAMASLFKVSVRDLEDSIRQGDILFVRYYSETRAPLYEITKEFDVAPSHTLKSDTEFRVHRFEDGSGLTIFNEAPATLEHPSHAPVTIPPGVWRVHRNTAPNLEGGWD